MCVCMCVYVCMCACESMRVCLLLSNQLVGVCPSVVETADEDGVMIHIFYHQRRIIRSLGANWGHPLTNHKCQLTSVAPSMTHDTSEPTTVFTLSNSPANFVSCSCHLVLHCLDQVTHHQTHALSPALSLSSSLNSLLWWQSHRHWVERWWERAMREEEDIPIENISRRGWVRTLSHWPFSLCCLCLTPPQLCLSSNTKDCEELIGSKGTDTWHIYLIQTTTLCCLPFNCLAPACNPFIHSRSPFTSLPLILLLFLLIIYPLALLTYLQSYTVAIYCVIIDTI